MGLEIELEGDDSYGVEGVESSEGRRRLLVPRLALALTVAAMVVAAVTGLNQGRTAQRDRSSVSLSPSPVGSYLVDGLPDTLTGPPSQTPAILGPDGGERAVRVKVLNDGPRPVTLLGGTISSPDIATAHLIPAGGAVLGPGAGGTLRARASFTCRGGARKAAGAPFAEVSTATVANISIRTEDGRQLNVRIVVQQFNPYIEIAECGFVVLPDGQVLSGQQVGLGPSLSTPKS